MRGFFVLDKLDQEVRATFDLCLRKGTIGTWLTPPQLLPRSSPVQEVVVLHENLLQGV